MCSHNLNQVNQSIQTYCGNCGSLSLNNISLSKPIEFYGKIEINPFELFKTSITQEQEKKAQVTSTLAVSAHPHHLHINKRVAGIRNIKYIGNVLNLSHSIIFKAILYMDQIYIKSNIPIGLIIEISSVCILLAIKYNECPPKSGLRSLTKFLKSSFDFHTIEILCLQYLDYDLNQFSALDYLLDMFYMGITSNKNSQEVFNFYQSCISCIYNFVEDVRYLDFFPSEIAFAVIQFKCKRHLTFSIKEFINFYDVDNSCSKGNILNCIFVVYYIEKSYNTQKTCSIYSKVSKKKYGSDTSCSTLDSIEYIN